MIDSTDLCCSNCGGTSISPGTIQHGIDNRLLGMCHDCAPQRAILPEDRDQSPKANKTRRNILLAGPVRTKLTPLVRLAEYRPRVKPEAAVSMAMFGEDE